MKDDSENLQDNPNEDADEEGAVMTGTDQASREDDESESEHDIARTEDDVPERKAATSKSKRKRRAAPGRAPASQVGGASKIGSLRALLIAAIALIAGAAAGWFVRDARANAASRTVDPATAASAAATGPCKTWQQKVCDGTGAQSAACAQAQAAGELLPIAACDAALVDVPQTLAKVKAARAVCDQLVTKLCNDLGKDSSTCKMVQERTASFPPAQCKNMLDNYDQVVGQLKAMEQRGGPHMGQGAPPGPQGEPPSAASPHP